VGCTFHDTFGVEQHPFIIFVLSLTATLLATVTHIRGVVVAAIIAQGAIGTGVDAASSIMRLADREIAAATVAKSSHRRIASVVSKRGKAFLPELLRYPCESTSPKGLLLAGSEVSVHVKLLEFVFRG
jgi:hypothetical protein